MKRGMLLLNQVQLANVISIISSAHDFPKKILEKLKFAQNASINLTTIELSENEVEMLIDILPVTKNTSITTKTQLEIRERLINFIQKLRQ